MRWLLELIRAPLIAVQRISRRGARRWAESPAGVQLGLIAGLTFAAAVRSEAGWMAFVLFFWSLPGWIDRVVPGGVRRVLRTIQRKPAIGLLPLAAPLELIHLIPTLGRAGGEAALVGVIAGMALPLALGIPPDRAAFAPSKPEAGQPITGAGPGLVPGFVQVPKPRLTNLGPAIVTLGGAAAAIVGVFLPWSWFELPGTGLITADGFYSSDPGTSDGALALGLAVVIAIFATARLGARGTAGWRRGVAIGGGIGLITVAAWHLGTLTTDIAALWPSGGGRLGPGIGLVGFGGAMILFGGLLPARPARVATDHLVAPSGPFTVPSHRGRNWNRRTAVVAPESVSGARK